MVILARLRVERGDAAEVGVRDVARALMRRDLALIVAFLVAYVAAEASFLNFFPIFYDSLDIHGESFDQKAATAAYVISSFAFLFTIGRFVGGFITQRLGDRPALVGFSWFALAAVIAGRLLAASAVYSFMVFGLALSVLFPTASAIASRLTERSGSVMGVIYVASGLGGALGGFVVGHVSERWGIALGFDAIVGFVALVAILSPFVGRPRPGAFGEDPNSVGRVGRVC
jgi:fucose permease